MKKSIVWTAAAVAAVGFGVPAFAAISSPSHIRQIAPTPVVSVSNPSTVRLRTTSTTVPLVGLQADTSRSTPNSVEDVSGNCDEAEHANDAACAGANVAGAPNLDAEQRRRCQRQLRRGRARQRSELHRHGAATDDNSGHGSNDSGRGSNSGHGSDDSGNDNSGHGGGDD